MNGEDCLKKAYEFILNSDFEGAILWFEQAIAADPSKAHYHYRASISCARSGKWAKAEQYAVQALQLDPEHGEYVYHLQTVKAKLLQGEAELLLAKQPPMLLEAIEMLKESTELDPLNLEAYYMLGVACFTIGQLDEAAAYAREAIRLDPGHTAARRLFADVNRRRRASRYRKIRRQRRRNR
ncbi:tetratricopeptide repeat protein [Paenibacillus sp. GCM10023252]|uniref:tetratricopeptide repeat protein n=1 Tax=Paenibacillus sp. GCM10023252 TaxID=3252649 RepID=UPI0036208CC4